MTRSSNAPLHPLVEDIEKLARNLRRAHRGEMAQDGRHGLNAQDGNPFLDQNGPNPNPIAQGVNNENANANAQGGGQPPMTQEMLNWFEGQMQARLNAQMVQFQQLANQNQVYPRGNVPTMRDFMTHQEEVVGHAPIRVPPIAANHLDIRQNVINLMNDNAVFRGKSRENPNLFLDHFLEVCRTVKLNGVSEEAIKMVLFPFALKDDAKSWYDSLRHDSLHTWGQVVKTFLLKYCPPGRTMDLREEIQLFDAYENETLSEAWERYKALLRQCPNHGFAHGDQVLYFFRGLDQNMKSQLHSSCGGDIMGWPAEEALNQIEKVAETIRQYDSEVRKGIRSKKPTLSEVKNVEAEYLEEVKAMRKQLEKLKEDQEKAVVCQICSGNHLANECTNQRSQVVAYSPTRSSSPSSNASQDPDAFQKQLLQIFQLGQQSVSQPDFSQFSSQVQGTPQGNVESQNLNFQCAPIVEEPQDVNYIGQNQGFNNQNENQWRNGQGWNRNSGNQGYKASTGYPYQAQSQGPVQAYQPPHQRQNQGNYQATPYPPQPSMNPLPSNPSSTKSPTDLCMEQLTKSINDMNRNLVEIKVTHGSAIKNIENQLGQMTDGSQGFAKGGLPSNTVKNPKNVSAIYVQENKKEEVMQVEEKKKPWSREDENGDPEDFYYRPWSEEDEKELSILADMRYEREEREREEKEAQEREMYEAGMSFEEMWSEEAAIPKAPRVKGRKSIIPPPPEDFDLSTLPYPPKEYVKSLLNEDHEKVLKLFREVEIGVPLFDILSKTPEEFIEFEKEMRQKEPAREVVCLNEECSAIFGVKVPPKEKDKGSFNIPVVIGGERFSSVLCDLGASVSVMPRYIYEKLGLTDIEPTMMTLQMADGSIREPMGIVEDVHVKIEKFTFPVDFVVLDMGSDTHTPLLLGRPFLNTAGTLIDVASGDIIFRVGKESVTLNVYEVEKFRKGEKDEKCAFVGTVFACFGNSDMHVKTEAREGESSSLTGKPIIEKEAKAAEPGIQSQEAKKYGLKKKPQRQEMKAIDKRVWVKKEPEKKVLKEATRKQSSGMATQKNEEKFERPNVGERKFWVSKVPTKNIEREAGKADGDLEELIADLSIEVEKKPNPIVKPRRSRSRKKAKVEEKPEFKQAWVIKEVKPRLRAGITILNPTHVISGIGKQTSDDFHAKGHHG